MIIAERYDFALTTHEGIEVGIITDRHLEVFAHYEKNGKVIETYANELFDENDWNQYTELYNEHERIT